MKTSRQPQTIYRNQNALVRALFERAGDYRKVLCVALDYAKAKHVALVCDGHGEILKAAFPVENNAEGLAFLIEQVSSTARRRNIGKDCIFLGGEDEPSFVVNFTTALRQQGYLVVRVNAYEAKENRENLLASTDNIDLLGIAKTLLSRRARVTGSASPQTGPYQQLRSLTRARRVLVRQQTAASNRIRRIVDELFPGFIHQSARSLMPSTQAAMELMKRDFSAPAIARRKHSSLANFLRRHQIHKPEETAARLIALAAAALPPDPQRIPALQRTLAATVDLFQCLERNADGLLEEACVVLAATPYAMLTSIPGIGFVLATGVAGELGDPKNLGSADSLCAYAGIVPRTLQSGGPDNPPIHVRSSPRCNRILKDWIVQSAQKIHLYGPPELKDRISRWNANGQHGIFAAARRYLRLLRTLVREEIPYLTIVARSGRKPSPELAASSASAWQVIQRKWGRVAGGLDLITDENLPLGFWRRVVMETHAIELPRRP